MNGTKVTGGFALLRLWPLLIPVMLLLPGLSGFPYPSADANYSDLSITHYPNAVFLRQAITEWGQIPFWSPQILSGYPFAANSLSGLWYPLGWLALLFPLPLGFNLAVIFHLLWSGLGMYLLVRAFGRSHESALFGALAFEALPKVFSHYGAGHLTMIYAISWTPWLLLAEVQSWRHAGNFWLRQPGIVLALIMLADPRWAAYAGLLWAVFSLTGSPYRWRVKVAAGIKQTLVATSLAAPMLFPLLEYSQLSTRAQLTPADILAFSLPPAGLFGLLAPQIGGNHEWIVYLGVVVLLLAITAILSAKKERMDWLWIGITGFTLLFSMGENIPGLNQLARLPGFSLLRVPPRIWPVASLAVTMLAAGALDALLDAKTDQHAWRLVRLAFTGIIGLQAGFALAIWFLTATISTAYLWGFAVSLAFLLAIHLFSSKRLAAQWLWAGLALITLIDLGAADASLFAPRSTGEVLSEGAAVAEFLAQQPGQFRVFSPSYSIPQQTAAQYGLELADGVDPLQLRAYVDFMERTTGVGQIGYSITLPPYANSQPATDNRFAIPDVAKLARLNVGYLASEFELDIDGLDLVDRFYHTFVYRLTDMLPRAFIDGSDKEITITKWTSNRIEIAAEGPGRLVLSELVYPGWVATVDGNPVEIEPHQTIFRSVNLADGIHQIIFEFRPISVFAGLAVFLIVSLALFLSYLKEKRGRTVSAP
ncbi:MAG TPA: hypothetical protein VI703_09180 [Anaerolineales bacterium]|nr:hypothetical protein [Anaerolineales bacterium]